VLRKVIPQRSPERGSDSSQAIAINPAKKTATRTSKWLQQTTILRENSLLSHLSPFLPRFCRCQNLPIAEYRPLKKDVSAD
jgi:hypothetical protein